MEIFTVYKINILLINSIFKLKIKTINIYFMRKIIYLSIIGFCLSQFISSCTVERRLHNSGFHIKWNKNHSTSEAEVSFEEDKNVIQESEIASFESAQENGLNNVISADKELAHEMTDERDGSIDDFDKKENSIESQFVSENINNEESRSTLETLKRKSKLELKKAIKKNSSNDMEILLLILCFILPFLAVGLATDWDVLKVLICLLLSFLFWIPGVIYALLVVLNKI